ncbi:unnamed protein product [Cyprideis torosa]|uniref:Uncharacterized protein n=1 Tax=Cyprideis torosa TaxID=163714 RepID=A0A7R8WAW8_9CRUS|nr:unnamed protein product [Cyprideis torosa]CAG0891569.1 unnamed protein product [Cyprideis torosa]
MAVAPPRLLEVVNQIHMVESGRSRKPTCFSGGSASVSKETSSGILKISQRVLSFIVISLSIKLNSERAEAFHHNRLSVFRGTSDLNTPFNDCRAESSPTMEDHQNLEEFRTRVEIKSTEAGSGGYGIGEDFHDGEKDLLSSEVLLQPNANEMPPAKQDDGKGDVCSARFWSI